MSLPDPPPEYHAEMESLREQLQAVQEDHEATADRLRERRDENAALKEQLEALQGIEQEALDATNGFSALVADARDAEAERDRLKEQLRSTERERDACMEMAAAERPPDAVFNKALQDELQSTKEQLETLRELLANGAEIATHYMDTDGRGDLDGWIAAAQDALSNPAKKPCAYHAPLYVEGCRDCAAQNQEPDPASEPEAGNMGGVLHQERADHLRRAAQNQESKP